MLLFLLRHHHHRLGCCYIVIVVVATNLILTVLDLGGPSRDRLSVVTDIVTDGASMGGTRLTSRYPVDAAHHPRVPMNTLITTLSSVYAAIQCGPLLVG